MDSTTSRSSSSSAQWAVNACRSSPCQAAMPQVNAFAAAALGHCRFGLVPGGGGEQPQRVEAGPRLRLELLGREADPLVQDSFEGSGLRARQHSSDNAVEGLGEHAGRELGKLEVDAAGGLASCRAQLRRTERPGDSASTTTTPTWARRSARLAERVAGASPRGRRGTFGRPSETTTTTGLAFGRFACSWRSTRRAAASASASGVRPETGTPASARAARAAGGGTQRDGRLGHPLLKATSPTRSPRAVASSSRAKTSP